MRSTSSLPLLQDPLWPGVVAPDRVLSMVKTELFDVKTVGEQMTCSNELLEIELFDHLTLCKQMTDV